MRPTARVECAVAEARPTTNRCASRFTLEGSSPSYDETFALGFNDPIEYFHYESRWKPLAPWQFFRIPVLGHIRDRFIEQDPFSDSLVFTTNVAGAGLLAQTAFFELFADANLVFLKQRYAPNYIHSDEDSDPENNARYALSHLAVYRSFGAELTPFADRIRFGALAQVTELRYRGSYLSDLEKSVFLRAPVLTAGDATFGVSVQYYFRRHAIRFDDGHSQYQFVRGGFLAEF